MSPFLVFLFFLFLISISRERVLGFSSLHAPRALSLWSLLSSLGFLGLSRYLLLPFSLLTRSRTPRRRTATAARASPRPPGRPSGRRTPASPLLCSCRRAWPSGRTWRGPRGRGSRGGRPGRRRGWPGGVVGFGGGEREKEEGVEKKKSEKELEELSRASNRGGRERKKRCFCSFFSSSSSSSLLASLSAPLSRYLL